MLTIWMWIWETELVKDNSRVWAWVIGHIWPSVWEEQAEGIMSSTSRHATFEIPISHPSRCTYEVGAGD